MPDREEHTVRGHFHRWLEFDCRPRTETTLANHLEILAPDVRIERAGGECTLSRREYLHSIARPPRDTAVAEHLLEARVSKVDDGKYWLSADVERQVRRPDGSASAALLRYETEHTGKVFTTIVVSTVAVLAKGFTDSHPANRAASFARRWLYLLEDPQDKGFDELFGPGVEPTFDCWLTGAGHSLEYLAVDQVEADRYVVDIEVDHAGVASRHQWRLTDTGERYCQLESLTEHGEHTC